MDSFEALVRLLLEQDGYWTRQSERVQLTKSVRAALNKPSMPRTEIDIVAYSPKNNEILAMEVKSFLDSPGVAAADLRRTHQDPEGRYKLFTCARYRSEVFKALKKAFIERGLANSKTNFVLGLSAGRIKNKNEPELKRVFEQNGWMLWTPDKLADKARGLSNTGYENNPYIMLSKLLVRNPPT